MLAYLNGSVLEKGKDWVILRVGDLGYKVTVAKQLWLNLHKGDAASFYTHQIVRDDSHELVGFAAMSELEFFWKLTAVSGVGPKMALNLMSLGPVASVRQAVDRGDVVFLSSATGVGTKSAQRVVLELKGKLVDPESGGEDEVVSALENLGYSKSKARDAAGAAKGESVEDRVKQALRNDMLERVTGNDGWNEWILRNGGSFLQSWEWGTFQEKSGADILRLRDVQSDARILLVKRRLPFGRSYWYCPKGPTDPKSVEMLVGSALLDGADFIRAEPTMALPVSSVVKKTNAVQPSQSWILDVAKTEAELLAAMHEKTRYNIRLSERKGVHAYEVSGKDPNAYTIFADLLAETAKRDGFHGHDASYYGAMVETLSGDPATDGKRKPVAKLFFGEHDGRVLAANLMVFFGDTAIYLHGASASVRREVMAPHLLHWTCIRKVKEYGFAAYDFWGVEPEGATGHRWAGISRFKRGFGGAYAAYPGTFDLVRNPLWYRAYAFVQKLRGRSA